MERPLARVSRVMPQGATSQVQNKQRVIGEARDLYGRMGMPKHAAMLDALGR